MTLLYLRTNENINKEVKKAFKRSIRFKKKDKYVDFKLSDKITFLEIHNFNSKLKNNNYGIQKELINNHKLFKEKYFFEPYNHKGLSELNTGNNSNLFLTFSKPINNFLIVEFTTINPDHINQNFKLGQSFQLIFFFNEKGLIEDFVYINIYNN